MTVPVLFYESSSQAYTNKTSHLKSVILSFRPDQYQLWLFTKISGKPFPAFIVEGDIGPLSNTDKTLSWILNEVITEIKDDSRLKMNHSSGHADFFWASEWTRDQACIWPWCDGFLLKTASFYQYSRMHITWINPDRCANWFWCWSPPWGALMRFAREDENFWDRDGETSPAKIRLSS